MTRNTRVVTTCLLLTWAGVGCANGGADTTGSAPAAAAPPAAQTATGSAAPAAASGNLATPQVNAGIPQPTAADVAAAAPGGVGVAGSPASASAQTQPSAPTAAGQPALPGDAAAPATGAAISPQVPGAIDHTKDIRGTCTDLKTNFPDDHACIVAPSPEEGFQIHVGPSNYDDPAEVAKFVMKPGEESTECYTFRTTNAQELIYQTSVLSGRSGTHHIINTTWSGDLPTGTFVEGCGAGADPFDANAPMQTGSIPGASKAYMERRSVAPEFADVGRKMPAKALVTSDIHYYNFTDKDILREYWVNLYYPPKEAKIARYASDIAAFGGFSWNSEPIMPGTDMVYKYECPITGNGFIMNLLGHYHLHGHRFGVSIKHASTGISDKVFEMYDPRDPAVFDYNSVIMNPTFSALAAGAASGILAVSDGDTLQWECHIINDGDVALAYTNEVNTGEMCNTWGFSVGIDPLQCGVP